MRPLLLLVLGLAAAALPACKSVRTVTAGPRVISDGSSDYSPEREAQLKAAGQQAASSGIMGQFGGGSAFNSRFGNRDPGGYGSDGLNAMAEKMFGGNTKTSEMKSFAQTKDFLTKRYTNTRELHQKESFTQRMSSWLGRKKALTGPTATEAGRGFYDGGRVLAEKTNVNDGRTLTNRSAHESERMASSRATKDFYPAKKVIDRGADKPKIIGEGGAESKSAVQQLIKSRPRDNPATVEEIRQLLGKTN
jgi:hypothetical protein